MKKPRRIHTPEEYEKDRQLILSLFKAGIPMRRMLANLGYTKTYINKIKNTLIAENLITQEEIEIALEKYLQENPPAQGLNKTRVRKQRSTEKEESRHDQSMQKMEKTFELVKQQHTKTQIAKELGSNITTVDRYIKALIEDGRIKKDEIRRASDQSDKDVIDKNDPEYISKRDEIVQYLRKGWKNNAIRNKLDISPYEFNIYIRDIKKRKIITSEEINEARENKKQEDLQFIVDSVKSGISIREMKALKPEFTYNEFTPMIKELVEKGLITQEQINENKINSKRKAMNINAVLLPDEQIQFILDKVREGYTPLEIVNSDETKSLTINKVLFQKRQLIAKGIISDEEAKKAMQERQDKVLEAKHEAVIKKIKEYTELGYMLNEMMDFITEYNYASLTKIRKQYIKENGWYTEEELQEFELKRKEREAEEARIALEKLSEEEKIALTKKLEEEKRKRQEELKERYKARKEETQKVHQEYANQLKGYLRSGKTMEEAAQLMAFSVRYIYNLKKESIQNNTWFTSEELNEIEEIKKQEKERENQIRIKDQVSQYREYIKKGYNNKEISKEMGYSLSYLNNLRGLAVADNIWFTKKQIARFKRLREAREAKEELARQKIEKKEQERIEKEQKQREKELKKEKEIEEEKEKQRKRKIKGFQQEYKAYRKVAKKEDKLELDGEENISIDGRKKFIDILMKLHELNAEIPENDIQIVLDTIYSYPEIANKDCIKFLISDANKKGGIKSAEKMTIELMDVLRNTNFYKPLVEYNSWIRKVELLPRIQELKNKGMDNTNIGEKLAMSSAEVSIILNRAKKTDFMEFE